VKFYRDVVGLDHRFTDAGYAEFATGATRFAVYERRRAEWLTGHPVLAGPGGEIVPVVEDVDAVASALRARGVTLLAEPADRPWGHPTVHVADPDAFVVEFAQEIPGAVVGRVRCPDRGRRAPGVLPVASVGCHRQRVPDRVVFDHALAMIPERPAPATKTWREARSTSVSLVIPSGRVAESAACTSAATAAAAVPAPVIAPAPLRR
jgi:lactoylglutathione lyase